MATLRKTAYALGALAVASLVGVVVSLKEPAQKRGIGPSSYDSGPNHIQYIVCSGAPCLASMKAMQQALNVQYGYGVMVDGGYVSTPKPDYWPDGALSPYPTTDEAVPIQNPVLPGVYRFEVLDRDFVAVSGILDGGLEASLPAPIAVLDVTWSSFLLDDADVLLPDGAVTSVAVLQAALDAGVQDSGMKLDGGSLKLDGGMVVLP